MVVDPPCVILAIATVPRTDVLRRVTVGVACKGDGGFQLTLNDRHGFGKKVVLSSDYRPAYFVRSFTMTAQEIRTTTVNIRAWK